MPVSLLSLLKAFGWRAWRTQPTATWLRLARWVTQCRGARRRSRRARAQAPNLILTRGTSCCFPYFFAACQRALPVPQDQVWWVSSNSERVRDPEKLLSARRVAAQTEQEESSPGPSVIAASHSISHQLSATSGLEMLTVQAMPQRHFSKWEDHKLLNTVHKGFLSPWV